jgi:DNA-binding NarL/FixJ family response regulator
MTDPSTKVLLVDDHPVVREGFSDRTAAVTTAMSLGLLS